MSDATKSMTAREKADVLRAAAKRLQQRVVEERRRDVPSARLRADGLEEASREIGRMAAEEEVVAYRESQAEVAP